MKKIIVAQITLMVFAGMFLVFSEAQAEYTLMRSLPGFGGGEVRDYVPVVIRLGIALAALLAVVMIVVAGFMYITAAGSPGKTEKAKTIILDAIIGLLIAIGYWLILQAINPAILSGNIPSLESAPGGHVDAVGGGGTTGSVGGGGGFSPEGYADIYESGGNLDADPSSVPWAPAGVDWRGTDAERDPYVDDSAADAGQWSFLDGQGTPELPGGGGGDVPAGARRCPPDTCSTGYICIEGVCIYRNVFDFGTEEEAGAH